MKLSEHVDKLRTQIEAAFDKQFARLGIGATQQIDLDKLPSELHKKRQRFEEMLENHVGETGCYKNAREKLLDELTFTLFNRIAAVKVMESASLFPPVIIKQPEHGDRSFGHKAWLEMRPDMRNEELEGIREYIKHAFNELGETLPLYSKEYSYALLPDAISLNEIIDVFNAVEKDSQVEDGIWLSDDILGWLYESYNNAKKQAFKDSDTKTEYDKVSLQSQVYTPRWVVKFLVENSLGKLYLEMYPDSEIKKKYKIANVPKVQERKPKPLREIKLIDPASGSGNFLLYAFDLFYELYLDQIENYGADYDEENIPKLIIENNIHGIDIDDRAVQLAQLGLYIKARKKCGSIGNLKFNVVSSDFFLPDYEETRHIFEADTNLDRNQKELIADIWNDLKYAYKFGSLIYLEQQLKARLKELEAKQNRDQMDVFVDAEIKEHKDFASTFFNNLNTAVEQYSYIQSNTFLARKTRDAIIFLELLITEYDIATTNPPYTDSSDFGPELKEFIEDNYKKTYKFHTNLYAAFIKRCYDLIEDTGFVAMVHPPTFMYIKTFEDLRKFIIERTHINFFVEWGYLGMFNPSARVDSALYILEKNTKKKDDAAFIKLNHLYETKRYDALFEAYEEFLKGKSHAQLYIIPQSKLKIIKSWPFIYWISDEFREKFGAHDLEDVQHVAQGLVTGLNERFCRLWWEVDKSCITHGDTRDKKWFYYPKGGPYKKWYGNNWLLVNWEANGRDLKNFKDAKGKLKSRPQNENLYYKPGITYSSSGSKGTCFRFLEPNQIISGGGPGVIPKEYNNIYFILGFLNSKFSFYLIDCLNPTVNTTQGDLKRIPFAYPTENDEKETEKLVKANCLIEKHLQSFSIINNNYVATPISDPTISSFEQKARIYFIKENWLRTQIFINEAVINSILFRVFELNDSDKTMVLAKEGESIGGLPAFADAREAFLTETGLANVFPLENIRDFIEELPVKKFTAEEREAIESKFPSLYQSNNDLEEFCIRHQVNPINVWYWFKQSNVVPKQRLNTLALEFLVDMIREILMKDEDGIIPLVPNAGEKILLDRIEEKMLERGFTMAQYSNFDTLLERPVNEFLNNYFFAALSDHLNLFPNLPKTPFIWHLTSGPEQGFDCYLIIYKWSRDKLMRLRSVYIENRERALINRQSDLANNDSADAQNEKDKILKQLKEIETFKVKIDELLAEGYNPILDDGVGKNIAPLQKKKMIPYEVLNAGQLKKYLNADW